MKRLSFRFMALALIGFLMNLGVHIKVILSPTFVTLPIYHLLIFILTIGLFTVLIPAVLAMGELTSRNRNRQDFWKVAFQALPPWATFLVWMIILYGFVLGGIQTSMRVQNMQNFHHPQEWIAWKPRVESGQYISFYCIAAAVLHTRWRR